MENKNFDIIRGFLKDGPYWIIRVDIIKIGTVLKFDVNCKK